MYISTWVNSLGIQKIKYTFDHPLVRLSQNPNSNIDKSEYRFIDYVKAKIGDVDYYGWYMTDIYYQESFFYKQSKNGNVKYLEDKNVKLYRKYHYNKNRYIKRLLQRKKGEQ